LRNGSSDRSSEVTIQFFTHRGRVARKLEDATAVDCENQPNLRSGGRDWEPVDELSMMMRDGDVEVTPLLIQDERYNDLF
jgi:hypothetical protein